MNRSRGIRFDDENVAHCYRYRPPYPPALLHTLIAKAPGLNRLLDLGTGPGKIAGPLASHFGSVVAIDPSASMLEVARVGWQGQRNIEWVLGRTEEVALEGTFDLVTIGAALHWMDPERLADQLRRHLTSCGWLAVIEGDDAFEPPWRQDWIEFLTKWVERLGGSFQPDLFALTLEACTNDLVFEPAVAFDAPFEQSVDDFIECQHSRSTWTRAAMGVSDAGAFDAELRSLLLPYAVSGRLTFTVRTNLTLARPR